jgi:hypothetical protein
LLLPVLSLIIDCNLSIRELLLNFRIYSPDSVSILDESFIVYTSLPVSFILIIYTTVKGGFAAGMSTR